MFLFSGRGYWQELIESIVLSGADEASTLQFLAPYSWMYRDLQCGGPTRSKSTVKSTSKIGAKKGPKSTSRTKKSRKTSKFQKERSRKRGQKWTSKTEPNSTENIQSNFPQKSTKNPVNSCSKCPRSLITSLNFICLRKFPPCERSEHPVPP